MITLGDWMGAGPTPNVILRLVVRTGCCLPFHWDIHSTRAKGSGVVSEAARVWQPVQCISMEYSIHSTGIWRLVNRGSGDWMRQQSSVTKNITVSRRPGLNHDDRRVGNRSVSRGPIKTRPLQMPQKGRESQVNAIQIRILVTGS